MGVPAPIISCAIQPKTSADQHKLGQGLQTLMAEDPTFRIQTDQQTRQTIIAGMGELQLEIIVDRLKREFGVDMTVGKPQVAYKETIMREADGDGRYLRQTGSRGEYGHAKIHVCPGARGSGYAFGNDIAGGAIPKKFINPVDEGIREALVHGIQAGYPVDDVRVELYDGSYHDVDSSETAFRIAGAMAFQDAAKQAMPVLLEPVMRAEVVVPNVYLDDVLGNLAIRRAEVQSRQDTGDRQIIAARVPLAEMLGYAADLRSRTHGLGTWSMSLERYQPVASAPPDAEVAVREPRDHGPRGRRSAAAVPEPEPEPDRRVRATSRTCEDRDQEME